MYGCGVSFRHRLRMVVVLSWNHFRGTGLSGMPRAIPSIFSSTPCYS
jgi:hypothetical protein